MLFQEDPEAVEFLIGVSYCCITGQSAAANLALATPLRG